MPTKTKNPVPTPEATATPPVPLPEATATPPATRPNVTFEQFLNVVYAQRDKYPTPDKAAAALGMTESSFRQRLTRERKNFPVIFEQVSNYPKKGGRQAITDDAALEIFKRMGGNLPPADVQLPTAEVPSNESK